MRVTTTAGAEWQPGIPGRILGEAGLGLALLPTVTVADQLADGRVAELQPPAGLAQQHLWLAGPSSRRRSPAARAVHATLSETASIARTP